MTPTRRRFMKGLFAVGAGAAMPLDYLAELVGKPLNLAPAIRARYSDLLAQAMREASAQLADSVMRNNALLMKLKSKATQA